MAQYQKRWLFWFFPCASLAVVFGEEVRDTHVGGSPISWIFFCLLCNKKQECKGRVNVKYEILITCMLRSPKYIGEIPFERFLDFRISWFQYLRKAFCKMSGVCVSPQLSENRWHFDPWCYWSQLSCVSVLKVWLCGQRYSGLMLYHLALAHVEKGKSQLIL